MGERRLGRGQRSINGAEPFPTHADLEQGFDIVADLLVHWTSPLFVFLLMNGNVALCPKKSINDYSYCTHSFCRSLSDASVHTGRPSLSYGGRRRYTGSRSDPQTEVRTRPTYTCLIVDVHEECGQGQLWNSYG